MYYFRMKLLIFFLWTENTVFPDFTSSAPTAPRPYAWTSSAYPPFHNSGSATATSTGKYDTATVESI